MKSILLQFNLIVSILLFFINPVSAADKVSLEFNPFGGISNGHVGEYLYYDNVKRSHLNWEINPQYILGADTHLTYKSFGINFKAAFALPLKCGNMQDSDWMDTSGIKNDYSISENETKSTMDFTLQFDYTVKLSHLLKIKPLTQIEYARYGFKADNGYGWYGDSDHSATGTNVSYTSNNATFYDSGSLCGIDYERYCLYVFTGFQSEYIVSDKIFLSALFAISPYSYSESYDTHWSNMEKTRGSYYLDIVSSHFKMYKGAVKIGYKLSERLNLNLNCESIIGPIVKGKTYEKLSDNSYHQLNNYLGGTSLYKLDLTLGCNMCIF